MGNTLKEIAARDARIVTLQSQLLDHTGHVWAGLPASRARTLVTEINTLRNANGWSALDMRRRWAVQ